MAIFNKKTTDNNFELEKLPKHIAIIMDGNGRWATKRALPRKAGHIAGAKTFKKIASYANKIGIKYMTVYAFSTENWKRPQAEVEAIMNLFREYLKDVSNYKEENIKIRFIGDRTVLADDIIDLMAENERISSTSTGMELNIAINYGGRDEIINAVKKIANKVKNNEIEIDDINESLLSDNLYTCFQPDPDLVIRPSGEYRISNLLIWQSAYSEFWYSDILWPDFTQNHLDEAIKDYINRNRRFGGV